MVFFLLAASNTLGSTHKVQECQLMPSYFLTCVFFLMTTIKQYNAMKWVQIGPAEGIVVFFLLGTTNTLGSIHKLQECKLRPSYFLTCVFFLMNTIKQYNAMKWVQIGPAQGIVVFFLLGATNTLGSVHKLQESRIRTFYCLMVWRHLVAD